MKSKNVSKQLDRFYKVILLQLFLTAISLPILMAWGLPFSLATIGGNFIFSPLLTIFLLVSSLIFFCELLSIPDGWLLLLLEKINVLWQKALSFTSPHQLIGFPKPPVIILATLPALAFFIIHHKFLHNVKRATIILACTLILFGFCHKAWNYPKSVVHTIACKDANVTVVQSNNQLVVVDSGQIGRYPSADSWVNFTLIPELIKTTGKLEVDHLILLRANRRTLKAIEKMNERMKINHVWYPELTQYQKEDVSWPPNITIHTQPGCIELAPQNKLRIQTKNQHFSVSGSIDNTPITLYAAKRILSQRKKVRESGKEKHNGKRSNTFCSGTRGIPTHRVQRSQKNSHRCRFYRSNSQQ